MEQIKIELEVTKLMQDLQHNEHLIDLAIIPYRDVIEEFSKKQEEAIKPYQEKSAEIENKIRELILIRGQSLKTGSGNATYRKGAVRRTWDLDKLDEVCDRDEDIKARIWHYRKENIGDPSVTVKINTIGKSITDI